MMIMAVPKKNQIREGVLLSDFQSWKEIEEACKIFDCGMYICMYIYVCVYIYVCMYTYIYVYIYV
jgi:hypothetical protein